jgi:hypothetical protein
MILLAGPYPSSDRPGRHLRRPATLAELPCTPHFPTCRARLEPPLRRESDQPLPTQNSYRLPRGRLINFRRLTEHMVDDPPGQPHTVFAHRRDQPLRPVARREFNDDAEQRLRRPVKSASAGGEAGSAVGSHASALPGGGMASGSSPCNSATLTRGR